MSALAATFQDHRPQSFTSSATLDSLVGDVRDRTLGGGLPHTRPEPILLSLSLYSIWILLLNLHFAYMLEVACKPQAARKADGKYMQNGGLHLPLTRRGDKCRAGWGLWVQFDLPVLAGRTDWRECASDCM